MPTYLVPSSDKQRRYHLNQAAAQARRDQLAGSALLSTERTAALSAQALTFSRAMDDRLVAEQAVQSHKQALETAVTAMKVELKQAWTAVRASVAGGIWPSTAAAFYAIPASDSAYYPKTSKEWVEACLNTLHGDELATGQGIAGLPNRAQLQTTCSAAETALEQLQTAEATLVDARQTVIDERSPGDDMLKLVVGDLRNAGRLQSKVEVRRLLRAYGAQFRYKQNEPVDAEDAGAPDLPTAI